MNGFVETLISHMARVGIRREWIFTGRKGSPTILPGYFRASKEWDLVVVRPSAGGRTLQLAVELKSQTRAASGKPEYGKNYNNRVEEALGSSEDLWTAVRERAFGDHRPRLGYLFVLEDEPATRKAVAPSEPHFEVFAEFKGASYAQRYELLCRKLVLERKYDFACLLLVDRRKARPLQNYQDAAPDLSGQLFVKEMLKALI